MSYVYVVVSFSPNISPMCIALYKWSISYPRALGFVSWTLDYYCHIHIICPLHYIIRQTTTQIAWVLSYVQGGVAAAWKNNLLDELAKEESEIETMEALFKKI